jgi:hypothetical protein
LLDPSILARRPPADAINPKHIKQSEGVIDMIDCVTGRQRALREGFIAELALSFAYQPCPRHDDAADDGSDRVNSL